MNCWVPGPDLGTVYNSSRVTKVSPVMELPSYWGKGERKIKGK